MLNDFFVFTRELRIKAYFNRHTCEPQRNVFIIGNSQFIKDPLLEKYFSAMDEWNINENIKNGTENYYYVKDSIWNLILLQFSINRNLHYKYHQISKISFTFVCNEIIDHSDVVGASFVGAAPTTSSFLTKHLASLHWAKATARRDEKHLRFRI